MGKQSNNNQGSKKADGPIFIETDELSTEMPTFIQFQAVRDNIKNSKIAEQWDNNQDSIDIETGKLDLSIPKF